jgi:hypothetical protein
MERLDPARVAVVKLVSTQVEGDDVLRLAAQGFDVPTEGVAKAQLLDRIERFESVRQRSSASPIAPPSNFSDAIPLRSPASESEMSGWLVAVHTSLPGQPEFAITDDLGNVKAYVRPTTGLNLRRYVQQPVTVFGPQGFLPNLNAKQVVADRVVRLR